MHIPMNSHKRKCVWEGERPSTWFSSFQYKSHRESSVTFYQTITSLYHRNWHICHFIIYCYSNALTLKVKTTWLWQRISVKFKFYKHRKIQIEYYARLVQNTHRVLLNDFLCYYFFLLLARSLSLSLSLSALFVEFNLSWNNSILLLNLTNNKCASVVIEY